MFIYRGGLRVRIHSKSDLRKDHQRLWSYRITRLLYRTYNANDLTKFNPELLQKMFTNSLIIRYDKYFNKPCEYPYGVNEPKPHYETIVGSHWKRDIFSGNIALFFKDLGIKENS